MFCEQKKLPIKTSSAVLISVMRYSPNYGLSQYPDRKQNFVKNKINAGCA